MAEYYLGWAALMGVLGVIAYGLRTTSISRELDARRCALGEAAAALQSLANIAKRAAMEREDDGQGDAAQASYDRAYCYGRAAQIVASIPVDRL